MLRVWAKLLVLARLESGRRRSSLASEDFRYFAQEPQWSAFKALILFEIGDVRLRHIERGGEFLLRHAMLLAQVFEAAADDFRQTRIDGVPRRLGIGQNSICLFGLIGTGLPGERAIGTSLNDAEVVINPKPGQLLELSFGNHDMRHDAVAVNR